MTVHTTLTKLILCNNQIGGTGGIGIGFALTQESCCPLETLDLRLNPLGHEGTMGILRAVVRKNTVNIKELSLAGCLFEDDTGLRVAQMIGMNSSIERLNVSNNWFDHTACDVRKTPVLLYYSFLNLKVVYCRSCWSACLRIRRFDGWI